MTIKQDIVNKQIRLINVVVDLALFTQFTYILDSRNIQDNYDILNIGTRVLVEFANKQIIGFVWQIDVDINQLQFDINKLKPILKIFKFTISPSIIDLIKFTSSYYHYPLGQTLFTIIPNLLRKTLYDDTKLQIVYDKYHKQTNQSKKTDSNTNNTSNNIVLNDKQHSISKDISKHLTEFYPVLLHGITASGKTEVYLTLIDMVIQQNKQALIIVPEINLTPQLLDRFNKKFAMYTIAVVTSETNPKIRLYINKEVLSNNIQIIIGTRMSIFTDFYNLGIIIVDEEHDQSLKQNDTLRYNARDIAVYRANYHKIPIILGSATPSLESLYNYKNNKYHFYQLQNRAVSNAQLPTIEIIDLKNKQLNSNIQNHHTSLHETSINAITNNIQKQELSLVFINRRGYAPMIKCYDCGTNVTCQNCSVNLVLHKNHKKHLSYLKCHHCGYTTTMITICKQCKSQNIQQIGIGTQKIETELITIFPNARIARIDQDSIKDKNAWHDLCTKIHNNEIDILVGTQMLSKGHDFHNLTLVVCTNLDSGLYSYDFRSLEYLFAQLLQVTGRAGRGSKLGKVFLETKYKEHPLFHYLIKQDYLGFAEKLLENRKQFHLPPYYKYALFRASATNITKVMHFLTSVYQLMQTLIKKSSNTTYNYDNITVYPPVSAVIQKLQNQERAQILISSNNRTSLHLFIDHIYKLIFTNINKKDIANIRWHCDIDPIEL